MGEVGVTSKARVINKPVGDETRLDGGTVGLLDAHVVLEG
jgi:hypothetical protein